MKTWTGSDAPLAPGVGEVNILDIVVHLGRERRWGGWGSQEWTVLHHSMLVALIWLKAGYPKEFLAYVLSHDFHEYCMGDIPSPVKRLLGGAKDVEGALDLRLHETLNLPPIDASVKRLIKLCDFAALVIEAPLFGPPGSSDGETATALKVADPNPEVLAFQDDVKKLVEKVMPNFELVLHRRSSVGSR